MLTVESSHAALASHASAAISVSTAEGERLVIVAEVDPRYRRRAGTLGDFDEVIDAIREAVADTHELQTYGVSLVLRGGIPRTSSGKIQRHACRRAVEAGTLDSVAQWMLKPLSAAAHSLNVQIAVCT